MTPTPFVRHLAASAIVGLALSVSLAPTADAAAVLDGTYTRVDNLPDGSAPPQGADAPALSATGRYSTFSAHLEVVGGNPASQDIQVFRYDSVTRRSTLVSRTHGGHPGDGDSYLPTISDDGRYVVYSTGAGNLPGGRHDGGQRTYRYDARTGRNQLLTPQTVDGQPSVSDQAVISGNGRYVALATYGAQDSQDTNGRSDVYLWDARTGRLQWVSTSADGSAATADSYAASVSNDGQVTYTFAQVGILNEVDYPPLGELWDPATGRSTQISDLAVTDQGPEISDNARYVTFTTPRTAAGTGSRLYSYDVRTGQVTEIVDVDGTDRDVAGGLMNASGRWVLVTTSQGIFGTPGAVASTFLLDRVTGHRWPVTDRADVFAFDLSADGRRVGFLSNAGDLPGAPDGNTTYDAFVWRR